LLSIVFSPFCGLTFPIVNASQEHLLITKGGAPLRLMRKPAEGCWGLREGRYEGGLLNVSGKEPPVELLFFNTDQTSTEAISLL
jgi:hypothetical protein